MGNYLTLVDKINDMINEAYKNHDYKTVGKLSELLDWIRLEW
jgi:hypothetical protein